MQHSEKMPVATKSTATSGANCWNNEKNYCNISRTTPAIFPFLKKHQRNACCNNQEKVSFQHSTSSVATLKKNRWNNDEI
jgi:hypothetical protein